MTVGTWALAALLALATAWGIAQAPPAEPIPVALIDAMVPPEQDPPTGWQLSRLHSHPSVLIVEFSSLAEQGEALNRAAALIEKRGAPRDRVLDDPALADFIRDSDSAPATFYYGHDYTATQLARLYSLARQQGVALRPAEQRLLDLLQRRGLLHQGPQGVWGGQPMAAIATIARAQRNDPATPEDDTLEPGLRQAVLRHELSHGVFFVDARYREACRALWRHDLTDAERRKLRAYFAGLGYDPQDDDLMANELQAFLLHTPAPYGLADAPTGAAPQRLDQWRTALLRRTGGRLPLHLP